MFGNLRKISENFGNGSKVIFKCFNDFFKIFGKSSEVFRNLRKISGRDRKCSSWFEGVEEFRKWLLRNHQMDASKLLRASNDRTVERNTTRSILPIPVAYRRIYATVILASDWLYFSRYGIKYNTAQRKATITQRGSLKTPSRGPELSSEMCLKKIIQNLVKS